MKILFVCLWMINIKMTGKFWFNDLQEKQYEVTLWSPQREKKQQQKNKKNNKQTILRYRYYSKSFLWDKL